MFLLAQCHFTLLTIWLAINLAKFTFLNETDSKELASTMSLIS